MLAVNQNLTLKKNPFKWWLGLSIFTMILVIVVFWATFPSATTNPVLYSLGQKIQGESPKDSTNQIAVSDAEPSTSSHSPQVPSDEDKVAAILGDQNLSPSDAVKLLMKELPSFDDPTQQEAALHIANLSDEQSAVIWSNKLISNQLPPIAAEILFHNLLTRAEDLVLPTLASIADQATHPQQAESAQILDSLLGAPDTGYTWKDWLNKKTPAGR